MTQRPNDPTTRLIGAHMPTAGGICNALKSGHAIGCNAVQVFTSSPRQWKASPVDPVVAAEFQRLRDELGIGFTVAHDSYLINLAANDPEILSKSRQAFIAELERAEAYGIPWVVTHMGAHSGGCEEDSITILCRTLTEILAETEGMKAGIALETTAGQGTCLGHSFPQIATILNGCSPHPRIGVCLDTCHIFVAGYDIRDAESYEQTIQEFDRQIGLECLKCIHANDAKKPLGSRVDRHEHIGRGEIGIDAFARLMTDSRLAHIPVVVETPDSDTMHAVNVDRLKRLAAGEATGIRVKALLFGHYRDYLPDGAEIEVPTSSSPTEVAATLAERDSRFAGIEKHCRFAVNEEYVGESVVLSEGDTVAFIPPMSGG